MKLGVIQVRGFIGMHPKLKDTLKLLKLVRKNSCVVVDDTRNYVGMLIKLKDYITWGEIDSDTYKELLLKRGKIVGNEPLTENYLKNKLKIGFDDFIKDFFENKIKVRDVPGMKNFFRLTPPRKGFDKGGIKKPYSMGGTLGYRGKNINDLIRRML